MEIVARFLPTSGLVAAHSWVTPTVSFNTAFTLNWFCSMDRFSHNEEKLSCEGLQHFIALVLL